MAWHQTGKKPSFEPKLTQFMKAYALRGFAELITDKMSLHIELNAGDFLF